MDWWIASQWEEIPTKSKSARVLDRRDKGKGIDKGNKYKELRKSTLKEIYIVRYADDFKIFCRKRKDADKIFHAVIQWLKQRLSLDISEEKSKIVNLRKQKSEFLGFEMKLVRKADKYVVQSHMSKKAMNKAENNLKEQIKRIQHPANDREQAKE
ncbi:TPA: reverse transcriptase domain-containing protein, partial [Clostridioides difficile]